MYMRSTCNGNESIATINKTCQKYAMAHITLYKFCEVYINLYSMKELQTSILMYKLYFKENYFEIYWETLECQMIQVFRQIENK